MFRHVFTRILIGVFAVGALACDDIISFHDMEAPQECVIAAREHYRPTLAADTHMEIADVAFVVPALPDPKHVPHARNRAEQIAFAHLYETLVTIDCAGRIGPGLSTEWSRHDGGRHWVFRLRRKAAFWGGIRVTADLIATCWEEAMDGLLTVSAGIDSVRGDDDRNVHVYFERPLATPAVLADADFAICRRTNRYEWPRGTGSYHPAKNKLTDPAERLVLSAPDNMSVGFRLGGSERLRDQLALKQIAVTADPSVVSFESARQERHVFPLSWDRTYVLVSATRAQRIHTGESVGDLSRGFRKRLASDAVRSDARAASDNPWWDDPDHCSVRDAVPGFPTFVKPAAPGRILYDTDDMIARDLAERIVALAATDPSSSPDARELREAIPGIGDDIPASFGVTASELETNLREGTDFAYVIALPVSPPDACYAARRLVNEAPWLSHLNNGFGEAIVPLVDARDHLITRQLWYWFLTDGNHAIRVTNLKVKQLP